MAKPTIYLARLNEKGSVASITSDSGNVDLVSFKSKKDPVEVCAQAAAKLRALADSFDRLAAMSDPFNEKSQKKAMKA